ncbi:PAS domain S-box protein [Azospirillum canadense]|uniref:PAS domain S-box protein n=1 Tax=Azospirillum canadense TaxID=403962 RepID=UPI002226A2C3|nr:PAS domain S-box protein [Azospirillum canadense]MCW2243448.1 PAS domain S-box-containing protein [Azospirillum canadense]
MSDDALLVIRWREGEGCRIDAASPTVLRMLGETAESEPCLQALLHPLDRDCFLTEIARARRCGHDRARHADHRVVDRDGRVSWWQTVTVLHPQPDGGLRAVSHAFDITGLRGCGPPQPADALPETAQPEHAQPEHAMPCAERALLQAMLDSIPDLIFFKDLDSVFVGCNRAFAAFLGRSEEEIVGHSDFDLVPRDLAQAFRADDREALRVGVPRRIVESVRLPDGREALLETIKTPYRGPSGELLGLAAVSRDVTEARSTEETLRTLSLAVAQSPVAVVITDAMGKVAYVNARFTAMTGREASAVHDLESFALCFAETGSDEFREMWRVLSGGETWQGELPARRSDGGLYWASVTIAPVREADGRITNIIGTADDVTERRQAEEQMRRAQKMQAVGVLAGGIAHDFNNILTAILGYSHLALDSLPEGSEVRDDVAQVTIAAERAKGLVQQLLTFSRKEKAGREVVDLRRIVEEALHLIHPTVPLDVTIRFVCDDGDMAVFAAPTQIHQVVVNLCKNAVDAIGDDPKGGGMPRLIVVTLAHATVGAPKELARARLNPGRYLCLTVSDTGCGMDAALIERIFEPFFTTKAVDKGTGLGLAAVHGIVADHGGVIDVVSAPGEGSSFSIYLPRHDPELGLRAIKRGRGRILLVGDERTMLGMAGRLLRMQGFQVVASAGSRRGLALFTIAPERFDLVVLEQGPAGQAWRLLTLARAFAAASPGIPILVCTSPDSELEGAAVEAAGVTRILRTPVVPDQFVTLARQLVEERLAQKAGRNAETTTGRGPRSA